MSAVLPSLDHFHMKDFENIYEPAEDTYLLCDAVENDRQFIKEMKPSLVMEIGSGSGCVITFLAKLLQSEGIAAECLATDLNPHAIAATRRTAEANNVTIEAIQTDLFEELEFRIFEKVDILLFNPPYVVTPSEEIGGNGIEASWAGGEDGREVTDRVLRLLSCILSEKGVGYMVLIQENKPKDVVRLLNTFQLTGKIVLKRRARNEDLMIMKITRLPVDPSPPTGRVIQLIN